MDSIENKNIIEDILSEYREKKNRFISLKDSLLSLMPALIKENNNDLSFHKLEGRVKEQDSLEKKIKNKEGKYSSLSNLTDIVAIRIITYLESDVDLIATILEKEFLIDTLNSTDKRKLATNEFGYKSLHYVMSISDRRCEMTEYRAYSGIKFEIQIRSILQHAWAEIEHDLGYKNDFGIPDNLKRNFNRLSALLEVADVEFDRLKKELYDYKAEVPKLILSTPKDVDINFVSLMSLNNSNDILITVNNIITDNGKLPTFESSNSETLVRCLKYLKYESIYQIEQSLKEHKSEYIKFARFFTEDRRALTDKIPIHLPLMYFSHFMVSRSENIDKVNLYLESGGYSGDITALSQRYIDTYHKVLNDRTT